MDKGYTDEIDFDEVLDNAVAKIAALENEIDQIGVDKGPVIALQPQGGPVAPYDDKAARIAVLRAEIDRERNETAKTLGRSLDHMQPELKALRVERMQQTLYSAKDTWEQNKQSDPQIRKSEKRMEKLLYEFKRDEIIKTSREEHVLGRAAQDKFKAEEKEKAKQKEKEQPESAGSRFTAEQDFQKSQDREQDVATQKNAAASKAKQPGQDDRPSMSTRFTQGLGFDLDAVEEYGGEKGKNMALEPEEAELDRK